MQPTKKKGGSEEPPLKGGRDIKKGIGVAGAVAPMTPGGFPESVVF